MNCEEIEELAGAYVLGAVSDEERRDIEEQLKHCPQAAHLVQELQAVVQALPFAVPQSEPSPLVKERLLAAIHTDPTRKQIHLAPQPATPAPVPVPASRVQRARSQVMTAVSALLLVVVLTMGAWNLSLQHHVAQLTASNAALHQQVGQLAAAVHSNTPVQYMIKGSSLAPDASGQVTYIPELNMTVLVLHNLPDTKGTQVYQGWLIQRKQPVSIGILNELNGTLTLNYPGNIKGFDAAAITLEPGPQASKNGPKGKIVASGALP